MQDARIFPGYVLPWKEAYAEGGEEALREHTRRKPNLKNRVPVATEEAIVKMAYEQPAMGQVRVSNELRQEGIIISPQGVRRVWMRCGLQTMKLRLKALAEKVAKEGMILMESQLAALERAQLEKEAHGEIETEHPGYLGSQDTFYVRSRAWDASTSRHSWIRTARSPSASSTP